MNIENNNFTGVIPAHLLLNCLLKLNYSRNPYLLTTTKRECTLLNSNSNKSKAILGITISGVLIIAVALITVIVVYRIKFSRRKRDEALATGSTGVERKLTSFLYQDYSIITVPNPTKSRAFTLNEMLAATQTFNREIGKGGFGSVFFGKLPDGKNIAVKVLSLFSHQGVEEFLNEVDLLSRINHRNLVSLLGYCNETREVMLIYEHMSGGSLRDHLYGTNAEYSELNWRSRLKIVLDAGQGLEYLHVGSTPKIIHRDIKTANILLDQNMNGKLADFGLSRMTIDGEVTHITTAVKGTAGYLDPEYYSTQMLTEKSDVYSFGVVLLEIICGRPPIDLKLVEEELNMVRWVTPYIMEMDENGGKITEIIDKRLGGRYNIKSISGVAKVAMRCVQALPSCRPNVSEIVAELKEAIKHEDIASLSVSDSYIESDDRLAASLYSSLEYTEPNVMEWSDNNFNLSKVGR